MSNKPVILLAFLSALFSGCTDGLGDGVDVNPADSSAQQDDPALTLSSLRPEYESIAVFDVDECERCPDSPISIEFSSKTFAQVHDPRVDIITMSNYLDYHVSYTVSSADNKVYFEGGVIMSIEEGGAMLCDDKPPYWAGSSLCFVAVGDN